MEQNAQRAATSIERVTEAQVRYELEQSSSKYHLIGAWVAIIFDPVFALTDYFNLPGSWKQLLAIRVAVSLTTLATLLFRRKYHWPSWYLVLVPFMLISLQNAYTYSLIGNDVLLGHNLNYIALLIGGGLFILWRWEYSVSVILLSGLSVFLFMLSNRLLDTHVFFVNGGLLLLVTGLFMILLIKTRYDLTVREIRARVALIGSNAEINKQALEIRHINANLEELVRQRTAELQRKNSALEEYAFINGHRLRSPVATILGLVNILGSSEGASAEQRVIVSHLQESTEKLDSIVDSITKAIEMKV